MGLPCHARVAVVRHQSAVQVSGEKEFFAEMVVEAVSALDTETLDLSLLGIKKVQGGGLRDSFLIDGVAFKKTFSYAGFEMQKKKYSHPKILALNIELELKSEKENAEVNINSVSYQTALSTAGPVHKSQSWQVRLQATWSLNTLRICLVKTICEQLQSSSL